jgi:hypothetical protein
MIMQHSEYQKTRKKITNLNKLISILNNDIQALQVEFSILLQKKIKINQTIVKLQEEIKREVNFYDTADNAQDFATFYKYQKRKEEQEQAKLSRIQKDIDNLQGKLREMLISKKQYDIVVQKSKTALIQYERKKEIKILDEFNNRKIHLNQKNL